MKSTILAAFAAVLGTTSAATLLAEPDTAVVYNECDETVYVQSWPYDGSAAGKLTALKKGEKYSEKMYTSGSTIKLAFTKTLDKPLFVGYSSTTEPDYTYYEFSTEFGNPFAGYHNILNPGEGCVKFDCAANDANCYSTPASKKIHGCPKPVALYAKVCA